ncbi:hypothetical protein GCM10022280_03640 [Sphingomonas swuensis]|uniref:Flagella basal body P-ring formation protein FlgA n=1 Tax=Sphingomonas swuensis TaxID=977800 RepID=A0ABP7SCH1_9SPHN
MSALLLALVLATPDPLAPIAETPPASAPVEERLVRRGQPVTLLIRSGALRIATAGRALSDGQLGQRIRVVALATRRTLDGVVENNGEVRLFTP